MKPIKITHEEKHDDGATYYEGTLESFPGWTFTATVQEEVDLSSDVYTNYKGTRITDVSLAENGQQYISLPGDHYDGRDIPLDSRHDEMLDEMLDEIDLFFGPTPEERESRSQERKENANRIAAQLFDYINEHLQGEDLELVGDVAIAVGKVLHVQAEEA